MEKWFEVLSKTEKSQDPVQETRERGILAGFPGFAGILPRVVENSQKLIKNSKMSNPG